MSVDDHSALSTERLLEMFATAAKRFGFASSHLETLRRLRADLPIEPIDNVAERKQGALQVRAIGETLRARGTIPEAERLMLDDDPNVRAARRYSMLTFLPNWRTRRRKACSPADLRWRCSPRNVTRANRHR